MMEILTPRLVDPQKWLQKEKRTIFLQERINSNIQLNFKEYCQFSQGILDAPPFYFNNKENLIEYLRKPKINYGINRTREEEQQGRKIIGVISYGWDYAFRLMKGKDQTRNDDPLGIYSNENIQLQLHRIENMLKEIRNKKYKFQNFKREVSMAQELYEKQMSEQIDFIKLLRNILSTQMSKIQNNRKNINTQKKHQKAALSPSKPQIQQKIIPQKTISQIIKVDDYFTRKINKIKEQNMQKNNMLNDPITKYEEQRKFNMAVIRYYMVTPKY